MDIGSLLTRARHLHPRSLAVRDGERALTYAEVAARVAALAHGLQALGLARADRLSILAWNGLEFFETYFAAAWCGAILNPLNVRLAAREQAAVLRDSGARVLIADASFAPLVAALAAESTALTTIIWIGDATAHAASTATAQRFTSVRYEDLATQRVAFTPLHARGDDVAHLYYTSGTTGRPKGVMLTHANVVTHALGTLAEFGLSERDTWAHIAPMFHLADAWATFALTWVGGCHVMLARFEPAAALDVLETRRATLTNLIPAMLNQMVAHPTARERDWSALRLILSGGQAIAPQVVRAIVDTFRCEYVQTYGMTETSPYLTLSILKEHLRARPREEQLRYRAKTGRAFAAVELRVVGADGLDVEADERCVGEIRVRGATVTPGYWNQPEETARAFDDGWLKTGDLAVIDAEGYVTIVDRAKDMINTGGEKVYSTEVEHVLYEHPAVLEAAVYGVPDAQWGEAVRATVVLRAGQSASASQLVEFCRERLAHYKAPRAIEFASELPRTGSGKITKLVLRERAQENRG